MDTFTSSQESDILPPEYKNVLTAEYAEIINTVQQIEDPYSNDGDQGEETLILDYDTVLHNQFSTFELSNAQDSILLVAPLQSTPSPTCAMPATEEYVGPYGFEIQVDGRSSGRNWVFSYELYKLFINMNSAIHLGFKCDAAPQGLYVRALPIYCDAESFQEPVVSCLYHGSPNVLNQGFGKTVLDHILRIDSPNAIYDCDESSKRRSVRVALDPPQAGSDWVTIAFKFMCKNSCTSGMFRRAIQIIFTLEDSSHTVLGRHNMKVRICSCPKRDKQKEEDVKRKNANLIPHGKRTRTPTLPETGSRPTKQKKFDDFIQVPALGLKEWLDITDYAQSRLLRRLRIEKREPTEREDFLLKKYAHDLSTYE